MTRRLTTLAAQHVGINPDHVLMLYGPLPRLGPTVKPGI